MLLIRIVLLGVVLSSGMTAKTGAAEGDAISGDELRLARYVLTGFRESRAEVRTGAFRISGTRISKDAKRSIDHVGEIEGFVAFDFDRNSVRFERQEPTYSGNPRGGKYIKSGDMIVSRRPHAPEIMILKPTTPPELALGMFDVRTAGLANDVEFEANVDLDRLLGELLPEGNIVEASNEGELYRGAGTGL